MTKFLKAFAISALLLAPASIANAQVTFGVRIGEPPAPRYYRVPPQADAKDMTGSRAIGLLRMGATPGITAIGPDRRTPGTFWVAPVLFGRTVFRGTLGRQPRET